MIRIRKTGQALVLDYEVDFGSPDWINERLSSHGFVTIAKTFHFEEKHKLADSADPLDDFLDEDDELDENRFRFQLGVQYEMWKSIV
jgi:hypothetical protein